MADKLGKLLDGLASAASKIRTPISLAALAMLVIFLIVYSNSPPDIKIIAICALVFLYMVFTVGIKKGTPPKEDISEPTSFSTDLRVNRNFGRS